MASTVPIVIINGYGTTGSTGASAPLRSQPQQIAVAATGASGATGLANGIAAYNTAMAAKIAAIQGTTSALPTNLGPSGYNGSGISVNPMQMIFDGTLYIFAGSIEYTVFL